MLFWMICFGYFLLTRTAPELFETRMCKSFTPLASSWVEGVSWLLRHVSFSVHIQRDRCKNRSTQFKVLWRIVRYESCEERQSCFCTMCFSAATWSVPLIHHHRYCPRNEARAIIQLCTFDSMFLPVALSCYQFGRLPYLCECLSSKKCPWFVYRCTFCKLTLSLE